MLLAVVLIPKGRRGCSDGSADVRSSHCEFFRSARPFQRGQPATNEQQRQPSTAWSVSPRTRLELLLRELVASGAHSGRDIEPAHEGPNFAVVIFAGPIVNLVARSPICVTWLHIRKKQGGSWPRKSPRARSCSQLNSMVEQSLRARGVCNPTQDGQRNCRAHRSGYRGRS